MSTIAAKPNSRVTTVARHWFPWLTVFVGLAAAVFVFPWPAAAANCGDVIIGGGTRTCQCGDTLTTSYTMTADLRCNAGQIFDNNQRRAAIVVDNNNITLDCNGYAIVLDATIAPWAPAPNPDDKPYALRNGIPITCASGGASSGCRSNVTIKNCRFRGFHSSIYAPKATGWIIQDNRFEGRFRQDPGVTADPASEYAINIGPSNENGLTIQRNVFWSPYKGIYASFSAAGGRDVTIRDNDILDAYYVGMELRSLHERSEVANNRITVNTPDPAQAKRAALWLVSPEGQSSPRVPIKVYSNYLDCADSGYVGTNGSPGSPGTCQYGDLAITTTAVAVDIYDNVFTGSGWDSTDSISPASVDWCPAGQKKNVFPDELGTKGRVPGAVTCTTGGGVRKACKSLVDYCGAVGCSIGATVSISENTCLKDETYRFTNGLANAAFQITADNMALDCGHGAGGSIGPGVAVTDQMALGVLVDGRSRVTVNDCNVNNTREGIRLRNSTGALLRENVVLNTKAFNTSPQAVGQQYFYHVVSDPPGSTEPDLDPKHFEHFLYNPFLNHDPDARYTLNWVNGSGNVGAKKVIYYVAGGSVASTAGVTTGWNDFTANAFGPGVCTGCFVLTGLKGAADPNDTALQFGAVGHLTVANSTGVVVQNMDVNYGLVTQPESDGDGISLLNAGGATLVNNRVQNAAVGFFVLGSPNVTITDGAADDERDNRSGTFEAGNSFGVYARWSRSLTVTGAPATSKYSFNRRPFLDESGNWVGEVGIEVHGFTDPSIADAVTISNTTVQENQRGGILLYDVDQSNVWGNAFVDNGDDDDDLVVASPQCNDTLDNDGDGKVDFGGANADPDCGSATEAYESGGPTVLLQRSSNNKVYQNQFNGVAYGHALQIVPAVTPGGEYDLDPGVPTQQSRQNWVYLNTLYATFKADAFHQVGGSNFYGWKWKLGTSRCNDTGVYPNTPCASDLAAWPDPALYPPAATANNSIIPIGLSSGGVVGLRLRFSDGDRVYNNDIGRIDRNANGTDDEYPFGDGGVRIEGDWRYQTNDTWLADNRVENNHHHQIYLNWADGVQMTANTVAARLPMVGVNAVELWDGIRVANSAGGTIGSPELGQGNTILTGEGRYGINIVNSYGLSLYRNTIQDPPSGGDHWPYLNVGTNFVEYAYDPYNLVTGSGYYGHSIYQSNKAGREDGAGGTTLLQPIVYVYSSYVFPSDNSAAVQPLVPDRVLGPAQPAPRYVSNPSHLQIAWSRGWRVIGLTGFDALSDSDPVQLTGFTHHDFPLPVQAASVNGLAMSSCRSACKPGTGQPCQDACLILDGSSGDVKDPLGSCPVGGSCCDITNDFSSLTVSSGDGHGVYLRNSACNTFNGMTLANFNYGGRLGVFGFALDNSSYNTLINPSAATTFNANRTNVQDIWELKLWGNSDRNDFQRNTFNAQGAWETQCQTNTIAATKDGCCNATPGNGCDVDCGLYYAAGVYQAVDTDCTPTGDVNNGCDAEAAAVDLDCPIGVDPDAVVLSRYDKDGYCEHSGSNSDNICDPDCTAKVDGDCQTLCTSASNDCCHPRFDGTCDADCQVGNFPPLYHSAAYDCNNDGDGGLGGDPGEAAGGTCPSLYAFDPDCAPSNNNWCDAGVAGNLNDFTSLTTTPPPNSCRRDDGVDTACGFPNYPETQYGFAPTQYGGGRPLGSLNCTTPVVRFADAIVYPTMAQRKIDRSRPLAERVNIPGRFEGVKAEFGDVDGASLKGGLRFSAESGGVDPYTDPPQGPERYHIPYLSSGASYHLAAPPIPPSVSVLGIGGATTLEISPAPDFITGELDNGSLLGIGVGTNLIKTKRCPTPPCATPYLTNRLTFNWNATSSSISGAGLIGNRGWYWSEIWASDGPWWAYSGPEAKVAISGSSSASPTERRRVFVDTKAPELPVGFAITIIEDTSPLSAPGPKPLKRYRLSWPLVTGEDTSGATQSWTNNTSHYEIWYGLNKNDVNTRSGTVYVWEDIAASLSGLPREKTGACPWANYPYPPVTADGGDKDCFDSSLGSINCLDGTCETILSTDIVGDLTFNICAVDDFGNESCFSTGAVSGIQTQYGDVYSAKDLFNQEASTYANATYLLMANGIIDKWTTSQTMPGGWPYSWPDLNYPAGADVLPFPSRANNYTTATSSLPYLIGLDNNSSFASVVTKLQAIYGAARVKMISNLEVAAASLENPLGGKIYVCDGSCVTGGIATVGSILSLFNGNHNPPNLDLDGSGMIIVNGNLRISADVTYAAAPVATPSATKLKHLSSLTWLVLGDVVVDGTVKDLAGTFLILGRPEAPVTPTVADLTTLSGFGRLDSCYSGSCGANTLAIRGLVVARYFYLRRTKASLSEGSEVVIYDGRILANTPPGMEDLVKSLPRWGEGN